MNELDNNSMNEVMNEKSRGRHEYVFILRCSRLHLITRTTTLQISTAYTHTHTILVLKHCLST